MDSPSRKPIAKSRKADKRVVSREQKPRFAGVARCSIVLCREVKGHRDDDRVMIKSANSPTIYPAPEERSMN